MSIACILSSTGQIFFTSDTPEAEFVVAFAG